MRVPPLLIPGVLLLLLIASSSSAVTMAWTPIGNPGNSADTEVMTCCGSGTGTTGYGAVPYSYSIGTYEVTNTQYAEFLNGVARVSDPHGLYNGFMSSGYGGITQSGSPGSYSYAPIAGRENMPVGSTSYYDALRFANWMNNGQPNTGAQTSATTEDGAYTFSSTTGVGPRNPNAVIVLPTENEWYKAAYYDPTSASYFDFPTGTNAQPTCSIPTNSPNTANCGDVISGPFPNAGDFTNVGSYPASASPYGTFDQGGNAIESLETVPGGYRGEHFQGPASELAASIRFDGVPNAEPATRGFRLAMVPEPSTGLLVIAGLLGMAGWRRRP